MPTPKFTLTGIEQLIDGSPRPGSVLVYPNAVVRDSTGGIVMSGPGQASIDPVSGVWSIDLPADDPSLNPATGLGYTIRYPDRVEQTLAAQPAGTTYNVADLVGPDTTFPVSTATGPEGPAGPVGPTGPPAVGYDSTGAPYILTPTAPDGTTQPASVRLVTDAALPASLATAAPVGRSFMGRPLHPCTNTTTLDGTNTPQSNGTDTGMNTLTKHRIVRPVASVSVVFGNLRDFGGTANGNNITVRASVDMNGTLTPLYFNGRRDVVIEPDTTVVSDPVGVALATGADLSVRTRVTVSSGEKWPNNRLTDNTIGECVEFGTATTDKTLTGTITNQRAYAYGPVTVLAAPTPGQRGTLVGVGDSIMQGAGDDKGGVSGVNTYDWGFARRFARANGYPFVNVGTVGDTVQGWTSNGGRKYAWRKAAASSAYWAICDFGINDLVGGRTLAQVQADLVTAWTTLANQGIKVFQTTITPKTTSTDAWATTVNQTKALADDTIRTALNDWIRTTPAPLTGYFETADTVETARNSGIWQASYTSDGLHPLPVGHAAMAAAITTAALT